MEHVEYIERNNILAEKIKSVNQNMREQVNNSEYISVKSFKTFMTDLKWIDEETDNLITVLEVEDFIRNGPGRTRDIEYK
jgi:hypothetical protein